MTSPAIIARDLTVRFGSYTALEKVSLEIAPESFLAVVGPNGAGKSTFIRSVLGLVKPTSGSIEVFGHRPGKLPPGTVGYVPQVKTLDRRFPALSIELVMTGVRRRWPFRIGASERHDAMRALERVGMGKLAEMPLGKLSGGQLQRVYLARSLARRPRLILLDEPATGMDAPGEQDFYAVLEDWQQSSGATIIMVTHDLEVAAHHAAEVLVLNRRVIGFGDPHTALGEHHLSEAYGHSGHSHKMIFEGHSHD